MISSVREQITRVSVDHSSGDWSCCYHVLWRSWILLTLTGEACYVDEATIEFVPVALSFVAGQALEEARVVLKYQVFENSSLPLGHNAFFGHL